MAEIWRQNITIVKDWKKNTEFKMKLNIKVTHILPSKV